MSHRYLFNLLFSSLVLAGFFSSCKNDKSILSNDASSDALQLNIAPEGMQILDSNRIQALGAGVLVAEANDWVDAILTTPDTTYTCSARLKGDWVDHLQGDKWSFRIKLDGDEAFRGMRVFSLQDPLTRNYLSEYVYHQWLAAEDVLTTRYFFMPFTLNTGKQYTYAVEEHFDINLIESQHRRAGPILRFSEEFLWELRVLDSAAFNNDGQFVNNIDVFAIADIETFSDKTLGKDTALTHQYEVARTLMQQYRAGKIPLNQIFDMDKMAKFFAITDINQAYHGIIWHNLRFYFNPITQKLEPIGFDGFTEYGVYDPFKRPFIGYSTNYTKTVIDDDGLTIRFFNDFEFADKYAHYLWKYSDSTYLKTFFDSIAGDIEQYSAMIKKDVPDYSFDKQNILNRSGAIRANLLPQGDYTLRAFEGVHSKGKIEVVNHVALPVEVVGMSIRKDTVMYYCEKPVQMRAWNEYYAPPVATINRPGESAYVFYRVAGIDSMMVSKILPYDDDLVTTPEQELFNTPVSSNQYFVIKQNDIFFKPGAYTINKPVAIPEGYLVHISPGTKINLKSGAFIVSKSPVVAKGSASSPIQISSSDSSSMGFTVLQAKTESVFEYVIFDKLSPLAYKGWVLMGAVNMFESKVNFTSCSFINSKSEDALNIMRSDFILNSCRFANTDGDAFDSDFSSGLVVDCLFEHTGNDALDFSGSRVEVKRCEMRNLGDKGVSCGEQSTIEINNCTINHAQLGIAAKDLSIANVTNVSIANAGIGYLAFVKKKAFGKSSIFVTGSSLTNVKQPTSALDGCEIIMK